MKHLMQQMQQLQIRHKLILIIMSTVIIILLLAGSALIIGERYSSQEEMAEKLTTITHIIAEQSTAALSFDNEKVANEVLHALDNETSVNLACIYDQSQLLFAKYARNKLTNCPDKIKSDHYFFKGGNFELYQSIFLEEEFLGTVYIRASLDKLNDRLLQFILVLLLMAALAGLIAYLLANKLQNIISKPLLELANVARQISNDDDYTIRLPQGGGDEIGTLNQAFNDMLEQIYKRQIARDNAEQALSEREQDLLVTLNSIGDAVIVTDTNGKITRMNPVAEQLTGWLFKDAETQSLKKIFPIINASTRLPVENPVDKVISTGETVFLSNHTTLITRSGDERQIADSAAPIRDNDNQIIGLILVFNDVTEQYLLREAAAKSERDLQAIMDNSPAAIHVEDVQGRFIFINQQFDNLFHMHGKNVIGKTLHDIFPADIADEMQRQDKAVLSAGQTLETEESSLQDDGPHTYSAIKFPLFDQENNIYAVCSIATDITERKHQEEQIRRSQKMDALGKLTGGIAHDYNNMLGIIMGYAELLNSRLKDDPQLSRYASDIIHAAERGTNLTKKLLTFTRHKSADASALDINQLLQDQQLMLEKTLTARINLVFDLADDLWPVRIDSGDLEDAIINMSINASHAITGNGQLTLRTHNEQLNIMDATQLQLDAGDYVLLSITDTGSGMDEQTREKIFDPFFSTKGKRGTGLGLSQVYGFVKRSGGDIKVYSEPGEGSRFAIYFPRCNNPDFTIQSSGNSQNQNLTGNESILIVDDEPALLNLAQEILSSQGYNIVTANDGQQALLQLEKASFDLMISDVIMPNMDGYQLAKQVQQDYPNVKILMASGFTDGRHNQNQNIAQHLDLLHKPYTSQTLLAYVRRLLNDTKAPAKPSSSRPDVNKTITKTSNRTILIMDDEADIRELFSLNLEALGYDTIHASGSDEAIALYQQSLENQVPVDAVILDLNIPGSLDGREVAAKIRSLNTNAKIIVSSGNSTGPEMTSFHDYGFDGALEKIFDREKIKQLLDNLLS